MASIQNEGRPVDVLRVILNGYVAVFKKNRSISDDEDGEEAGAGISLEPSRELLKRDQSRLIRGGVSERQPNGDKSEMRTDLSFPSPQQSQRQGMAGMADPVGILPFGASFGQLQLFTGSKSPYSYAAYSSGHASTSLLHILTLPGRVAKLCLPGVDDVVVYNPVRTLRCVIKAKEKADRIQKPVEVFLYGLGLERLLLNQAALAGFPRCRLTALISTIRIVDVPARHFIYESGDSSRGALFVLLAGTARLFCYAATSSRQAASPQSAGNRRSPPRFSAKVSALMRLKGASVDVPDEDEMSKEEVAFAFGRRADDSFFSQAYSSSRELVVGDSFGCCGDIGMEMITSSPESTHGELARTTSTRAIYGIATSGSLTYQETAVAMTDCKVGMLSFEAASTKPSIALSASEKAQLMSWFGHRDDQLVIHDGKNAGVEGCQDPTRLPECVAALGLQVLEQADLAGKLSSSQRFELVKKMAYCSVPSGQTGKAVGRMVVKTVVEELTRYVRD